MAKNDKGEPDKKGFPLVTDIFPTQVPPVAGIDNAKLKVFEDYGAIQKKIDDAKAEGKEPPRIPTPGISGLNEYIDQVELAKKEGKEPPKVSLTTLESDLVTLLARSARTSRSSRSWKRT